MACFSGSRPRSCRRSIRPPSPNVWIGFAGRRVQRVHVRVDAGKEASIVAARPVHQPAVRTAPDDLRIERPQVLARCGAQRERLVRGRVAVQDAVDDDRLRLQTAGLPGVVAPGDLEPRDVRAIDLGQAGVAHLLRPAAIAGPPPVIAGTRRRRHRGHRRHEREHQAGEAGSGGQRAGDRHVPQYGAEPGSDPLLPTGAHGKRRTGVWFTLRRLQVQLPSGVSTAHTYAPIG